MREEKSKMEQSSDKSNGHIKFDDDGETPTSSNYNDLQLQPTELTKKTEFPNNVWFMVQNYVLEADEFLDMVFYSTE